MTEINEGSPRIAPVTEGQRQLKIVNVDVAKGQRGRPGNGQRGQHAMTEAPPSVPQLLAPPVAPQLQQVQVAQTEPPRSAER